MSSLAHIAKMMGGDTFRQGTQANIPGPNHSPGDRSVSLGLNRDGRVIVNCYGHGSWQDVLDDLRRRKLIDDENKPTFGAGGQARFFEPAPSDADRIAVALNLWNRARPVAGTVSEVYARWRGCDEPLSSDEARHLQEAPIAVYGAKGGRCHPAFMTAIRNPDGDITAVEMTYLTPGGRRHPTLKLSRKTIGSFVDSSACRIDPLGEELLVAEGYWTTRSARRKFTLPAWALMCTRNMRRFEPPAGVRRLVIARDNGKDGERSARILADRFQRAGGEVEIVAPPRRYDDFNTWHRTAHRLA